MNQFFSTKSVGGRLLFCLLVILFGSGIASAQTLTINGETTHIATVGDSLELLYTFSGSDTAFTVAVFLDADNDGIASAADFLIFHSQGEEDFFVDGGFNDDDGIRNGQLTIFIDKFFEIAPAQFIFVFTQESGASATAFLLQEHKPSNTVVSGSVSVPDSTANIFVFAHPVFWDTNGDSTGGPGGPGGSFGLGKVNKPIKQKEIETLIQKKGKEIFGAQQNDDGTNGPMCWNDPGGGGDPEGEDNMFFATLTDENGEFSIPIPNDPMGGQGWMIGTFDEFHVLNGYFPPPPVDFFMQNPPADVNFEYMPTNSQVVGTVTGRNGAPLLDYFGNPLEVEVFLWSDVGIGPELSTTVLSGTYVIDVLPGRYFVGVGNLYGQFLHPEPQWIEVFENDTVTVDFQLFELDSFIAGQVWIVDEGPLECARVEAKSADGGWTDAWTDPGGFFWLQVSSQSDPWEVWLDQGTFPPDLMVDGDPMRMVSAGNDTVNYFLIRREAPPSDPEIVSIRDIRGDQGKQVRVTFRASAGDFTDEFGNFWGEEIGSYHLWRRGPHINSDGGTGGNFIEYQGKKIPRVANLQDALAKGAGVGDRIFDGAGNWIWDFIVTIPAVRQPHYSYVAPTLYDSTANHPGWTFFRVSAQSAWSPDNWFSMPDSGYSVDNIFPRFAGIAARLEDTGVTVAWLLDNTPDLAAARIYRGLTADFSPDQNSLLGTVKANVFFDPAGDGNSYYIVELLDDAGNATLSEAVKATVTGVDDEFAGMPESFELKQNYPNPFNPSTRIMFAVPQKAFVTLAIFDVLGRKVRTLVAKDFAAGYHAVTWDARNQHGMQVPSGIYIYKLVTGNTVLQHKMMLTK